MTTYSLSGLASYYTIVGHAVEIAGSGTANLVLSFDGATTELDLPGGPNFDAFDDTAFDGGFYNGMLYLNLVGSSFPREITAITGSVRQVDWNGAGLTTVLVAYSTVPAAGATAGAQAVFVLDGPALPDNLPYWDIWSIANGGSALVTTGVFAYGQSIALNDIATATLLATDLPHIFTGTDAGELLLGTAGPDEMTGQQGADTLHGNDGDDTLRGDSDQVSPDAAAADNMLFGGAGNDRLIGGQAHDTLNGGDGDDFIYGSATGAPDLRDVVYAGAGHDFVAGLDGNDLIYGGSGNDTLEGGRGGDTIAGQQGDDIVSGGALGDLLYGNDGDDFLNGGWGSDRLNGGVGADRFYHAGITDHGSDWIQDYTATEGDALVAPDTALLANFQLNFAETTGAGLAGTAEAFVIDRTTGQILWALVDGAAQDQILLNINQISYDLLG